MTTISRHEDPTSVTVADDNQATEGMGYLDSPLRRVFTIYLPLGVFVFVLLFPFYWMAITSVKPNHQLTDYQNYSPFWVVEPTLRHIQYLLFETSYPHWFWNTILISVSATFIALATSVLAAYAIERLRFSGSRYVGLGIFLAYLVPPSILFIPLALMVFKLGLYDSPLALILTYPTFLVPFCTWLLMGYFRSIPYELEECALIDGATRWQILTRITLPLAVPGLISAGIFAFTLSWNEFIYALTFIQSSENKTVPVGVLTELVRSDVYEWGSLMAGALLGSLPVVILYSFFVEHYVSSMTGAVKE
jgi:multiple sugar transport system permease protein